MKHIVLFITFLAVVLNSVSCKQVPVTESGRSSGIRSSASAPKLGPELFGNAILDEFGVLSGLSPWQYTRSGSAYREVETAHNGKVTIKIDSVGSVPSGTGHAILNSNKPILIVPGKAKYSITIYVEKMLGVRPCE